MEDTMQEPAVEAFARLLDGIRAADADGVSAKEAAQRLYPAFRDAVGMALTDMREQELAGLDRWRESRHETE